MLTRVLSLKSSTQRRNTLQQQFQDLDLGFEFTDGVDGRVKEIPRPLPFSSSSTEAACALGHQQIYQELVNSNQGWALIFEDDIRLTEDAKSVLAELESNFLSKKTEIPLVLLLGGQQANRSVRYFVGTPDGRYGNHTLYRSFFSDKYISRACGYLINRRAAQALIGLNLELRYHSDEWAVFRKAGALQELWLLKPGIVIHPSDYTDSLLHQNRNPSAEFVLPQWLQETLTPLKILKYYLVSWVERISRISRA